MTEKSKAALSIIIVYLAYGLRELHLLFRPVPHGQVLPVPESTTLIQPFIFSEQKIEPDSFVFMISVYIFYVMMAIVMLSFSPDVTKRYFKAVFWLSIAEFVELYLTYNERVIVPIPFSNITVIRWFVLFYIGSKTLWNLRQQTPNQSLQS